MEMMIFVCSVAGLISFILLFLGYSLSWGGLANYDKLSPFECGFTPKDSFRSFFSLDFFLVALIFLVFDLELVILFPYLFSGSGSSLETSLGCLVFILLLGLGLLHEWVMGSLEWTS